MIIIKIVVWIFLIIWAVSAFKNLTWGQLLWVIFLMLCWGSVQ